MVVKGHKMKGRPCAGTSFLYDSFKDVFSGEY